MMQIEETHNEGANQESGRLQNERLMEYLRLEREREAAIKSGRLDEESPASESVRTRMDFSTFGAQKGRPANLLHHVLQVIQSSSDVLGIERDSWRFRITNDPRYFMDDLRGKVFHSFHYDSGRALQYLLMDLRDEHHFVVPHNARIENMKGNFLIMFSINTVPQERY